MVFEASTRIAQENLDFEATGGYATSFVVGLRNTYAVLFVTIVATLLSLGKLKNWGIS